MRTILASTLLLLGSAAALAQSSAPQPETVYSEAQRKKDISAARWLVDNLLRQSFSLDGEYARWTQPVCPHVYGLTPLAGWQIEHRVREVAQMVGAPVDREDPCTPNIGIIFTADPQASIRSIADKAPLLVEGGNQKLTVRAPIQAWYATFIASGADRMIDIPWEEMTPPLDGPPALRISGAESGRLRTGIAADMAAATVLVDSKAVTGRTLGEIADYVAMLTLMQAGQYGQCLETASITNLLRDCGPENTVHSLSHIDIVLLTSLYQLPQSPEALQKQRLLGIIRRSLEAQ